MAFRSSVLPSSSSSSDQPSQLRHHLRRHHPHHQPPSRLSLLRPLPLNLRLRVSGPQLPPLPLAGSSAGGTNNGNNSGNGSGGDGEGDGGASDGNRVEALFVLGQLGRKLESLPADLAAAVEGGGVTGEIVRRFAEMESSPLLRWLLQFQGFRERLLADDLFLGKLAMACGVGIITKTAAEYEKRRENFVKEIDIVIANVIMAIVADFMLVYLPAPTVSLQPPLATNAGLIANFFHYRPNNAFQIALAGRSFSLLQRLGAIVRNGAKLSSVGTSDCLIRLPSHHSCVEQTAAEYEKRRENFVKELYVVTADVIALAEKSSKRQPSVLRSSTEIEFPTMATAGTDLGELHYPIRPVHLQQTKYIGLAIHFVLEKVGFGEPPVLHVPASQRADVMTKWLPGATFQGFRASLYISFRNFATAVWY